MVLQSSPLHTNASGFAIRASRRIFSTGRRERSPWPRVRCAATRKRRNRRPTRTSRRAAARRSIRSRAARRRPARAPTARRTEVRSYGPPRRGAGRSGIRRDGVAGETQRFAAALTRAIGDPCQFAATPIAKARLAAIRSGGCDKNSERSAPITSSGCEPLSISRHQTGLVVLPIDPRAIRSTLQPTMRVGPNTGGEENG